MRSKSLMKLMTIAVAAALTACGSLQPPSSPPEYSPPPDVATQGLITLTSRAEISMSVDELRAYLLENPFISFFEPTENISPPDETEILKGEWPNPDAVRRVKLQDGHYVIERILENEPAYFSYQIWVFTNEAGRGVAQIIGEQNFVAIDDQTTLFKWDYNLKPKSGITRIFVNRQAGEVQEFMNKGTMAMAAAANKAAQDR